MRWVAVAVAATAAAAISSTSLIAAEILIFGGSGHREFLGCLNCSEYSTGSIWNEYSTFGWKNDFGKWNGFGQFASQCSRYSACNELASDPPVIVDRSGSYYGRLTINELRNDSVCSAVATTERLCRALKVMCATKRTELTKPALWPLAAACYANGKRNCNHDTFHMHAHTL